ncbi:MAG TPA: hypothetical protein VMO20_09615 [Candidatus Acidoferrum sp.]|nr:hypothetical protein [Candidatus Acidoferrum sp.]
MKFEQPASLNRYILPPIPFTWAFQWKLFKSLLPVLAFSAVLVCQTVLLRQWASGHWDIWPFFGILFVLVFVVFATEIQLRLPWKYKRIFKLKEKCIQTGSGLAQRVRWQNILMWQFSDVPSDKNYRIATMEYKWGKKTRRHSIALQKSEMDQLISELKFRQQKDGFTFSISDQESDLPPESLASRPARPPKSRLSLYLYLAGAFLFIEGLLLLMVGLGMKDNSPDPNFSPNPNGSFAKFIREHFHSVADFRHCLLVIGSILCGSGGVLMVWSIILNKKQKASR